MAGSSNTTWLKGFSGSPEGLQRAELLLSRLANAIGDEIVLYPTGAEDAVAIDRGERRSPGRCGRGA